MPIIINKFKLYSSQTILDSQTIISSLIDDEKLHNNLHQFLKAYFTKRGDFKDILPKEEDFLAQFDIPYDERDVLNINGKYIFDDMYKRNERRKYEYYEDLQVKTTPERKKFFDELLIGKRFKKDSISSIFKPNINSSSFNVFSIF